jgi:hypothetical protein
MEPSVVLTLAAEKNALAREVRRRLVSNLADPALLRSFRKMWGTLIIVCREDPYHPPPEPLGNSAAGTLTLRFDYGTLTIHEGRVGRPDATLWGSAREILAYNAWRSWVPGGVQGLLSRLEQGLLRRAAQKPAGGADRASASDTSPTMSSAVGPEVFGRSSHLRLLYRFGRLLDGRRGVT